MDDAPPGQNVARYRLTRKIAEQRIRALAAVSDNIKWSLHALDRMNEREIYDVDVLRVLRLGTIAGEPEETNRSGEWKCKMVCGVRGSREVGVVAIILKTDGLFIKTVEWEDLP